MGIQARHIFYYCVSHAYFLCLCVSMLLKHALPLTPGDVVAGIPFEYARTIFCSPATSNNFRGTRAKYVIDACAHSRTVTICDV